MSISDLTKVDYIIIEAALKTQLDCLHKMNLTVTKKEEASAKHGTEIALAKITLLVGRP